MWQKKWNTIVPKLALEIKHLSLNLEGQQILAGFNLCLPQGSKITLTGRSGCGKSTLLRCVLGFIAPDAGSIKILGQQLTEQSVWELRTRMAYVAQEPELNSGTVQANLAEIFAFHTNRHLSKNLDRVPQLLEHLLLPHTILQKETAALSGGEKQRIAIMVALLLERELLLLDEVTSALDQRAKDAVLAILSRLEHISILAIGHEQDWSAFADHVVDMSEPQGDTACTLST